jgi:hypothetical protein
MAARENQGLQIALIVFVMLTIVLIVTTFLFFQNYREEQTKNKTLTADASKANTEREAAKKETGDYKEIIGGEAADAKKDLEKYDSSLADGKKNYRGLIDFLATELKNANTRRDEAIAEAKELDDKLKANEALKKVEIAEYLATISKVTKDLEGEREKFGERTKEITASSADLASKFNSKRLEHEALSKKTSAEIGQLKSDVTKYTTILKNKNDEELRQAGSTEVADGKVTWVNQRSRMVYVNIGADDGLRRQTSFSVYSADESNAAEADRKAKIEVIRLVGAHLAEARIVDDHLGDPIMPGDQIFSPTWEPGRAQHFALAGKMDIDGDGESDRQRIRDLIALNGGMIDEEVADDGKKTGEMSINTKYLILGSEPAAGDKEGAKSTLLDSYSAIRSEAQTLGVKIINVGDFLDYMGYKPEERTINLGAGAKSGDFKARLPDGVQRVAPGSKAPRDPRRPAATSKQKAS